jgi:hypothetical protein
LEKRYSQAVADYLEKRYSQAVADAAVAVVRCAMVAAIKDFLFWDGLLA